MALNAPFDDRRPVNAHAAAIATNRRSAGPRFRFR
jgi:hypothetical protein